MEQKLAMITGVNGQDGAYLAAYLLSKSYRVIGVVRNLREETLWRLFYLDIQHQIEYEVSDLSVLSDCKDLLLRYHPHEIYNLAAQSSVSYSFEHPISTLEYNIRSVLNLLEAMRILESDARFYQASSSEMFGKVTSLPITIHSVLHPVSPYGISKATGHWLVNQYRESYGIYACSGILFNHESFLRPETFFVKKVVKSSLQISRGEVELLRVGNIDVKRDFGFAREYVKAIWNILQVDDPQDFVVCSGKSISLREIIYYVFDKLGIDRDRILQDENLYRPSEIEDIYGDPTPIRTLTNWKYDMSFFDVLDILIEEEVRNIKVNAIKN